MQICRVLLELGHSVTVITGAPAGIFIRELRSACLAVRKAALDFGAKQKDAFSVDMAGACPAPPFLPHPILGVRRPLWSPIEMASYACMKGGKCTPATPITGAEIHVRYT